MAERRAYPTDLSDEQWRMIKPVVEKWRRDRFFLSVARTDLREIVNAILYQNRAGCPWALLPHDFPPPGTVYGYFKNWRDDGTDQKIHDTLRRRVRRDAGRAGEPSAMSVDSQSVKSSFTAIAETIGYDGYKKVPGRKRHLAVDALGLLVHVIVTAADVSDIAIGRELIEYAHARHPRITAAFVDAGYPGLAAHGAEHGIDVQMTAKGPKVKGLRPERQRWKVERTFAWLGRSRRHARDHETLPATAASQIRWTMTGIMLRRLTRTSPITTYRINPNEAIALGT